MTFLLPKQEEIIYHPDIDANTILVNFNGEKLLLTKIDEKQYGHKLVFEDWAPIVFWSVYYLVNDFYYATQLVKEVLFEKKQKFGYYYYNYDFYIPVELIGKGSELPQYEDLFLDLKAIQTSASFVPNNTLILKEKIAQIS